MIPLTAYIVRTCGYVKKSNRVGMLTTLLSVACTWWFSMGNTSLFPNLSFPLSLCGTSLVIRFCGQHMSLRVVVDSSSHIPV